MEKAFHKHEYNGMKIKLIRYGENVEGILGGSDYGPHYNATWQNSSGQKYIGTVSDEEIQEFIKKTF